MEQVRRINTIQEYNDRLGVETLHPMVNVIDFSTVKKVQHYERLMFGFYVVFLKDVKCGDLHYGRQLYDYQEGTLVYLAPGQVIGFDNSRQPFQPKGWALCFHPDLLRGTQLGRNMKDYTFFSYESNEALHLSERERTTIVEVLQNIHAELEHAIDKHSRQLIVSNIELLLNYSLRYYDRQFVTRTNVNHDLLSRFESELNAYFNSTQPAREGLPSVALLADKLHLSANYLGDLIKKETGISAQEHIQQKLIDAAKERVLDPSQSISEIAYGLGFRYPQHFSRLFKQRVGMSPGEYRSSVN